MANVGGSRGVGDGSKPRSENIVPSAGWTEDLKSQCLLVDLPGFKKEQVQIKLSSTGDINIKGERVTPQNKTVRFDQTYNIPAAENADLSKVTAKFDGEILYVTIPRKPKEEEQKKRDEGQKEEATPSLEKKKDDVVYGIQEKKNATQQQKPEDVVYGIQEKRNATQQQKPEDEVVEKNKEENAQKTLEKDKVKDSEEKTQQKPSEAKTQQKPRDDEVKNKEGDEKSSKKEEKKLKGNESERFSEEDVKKWEDDGNCLRNTIKILSQNRGVLLTAVIAFSLGVLLSRRFQVGR